MGVAAVTRSERIRRAEEMEIRRALNFSSQWFAIPLSEVRQGDYIRFVNERGRIAEGRAQIVDGTVWCDFSAITPKTVAAWRAKGVGLERRDLPRLNAPARAMLEAIDLLDATHVRTLAFCTPDDFSLSVALDMVVERRVPDEWVFVYRAAASAMRTRMISMRQPGVMNFTAAIDAVSAAIVALQHEDCFLADEFAYITSAARTIEWPVPIEFGTLARNKRTRVRK